MLIPACGGEGGVGPRSRPLCGQSRGCDFLPDVKSALHFLTIDRCGESETTWAEVRYDRAIGGEKTRAATIRFSRTCDSVGESLGCRKRLEAFDKGCTPSLAQGRPHEPLADPDKVHGGGSEEML